MDSKRHLIERKQYSRPTSNNVEKIDTGSMNAEEIKIKMRELRDKGYSEYNINDNISIQLVLPNMCLLFDFITAS